MNQWNPLKVASGSVLTGSKKIEERKGSKRWTMGNGAEGLHVQHRS